MAEVNEVSHPSEVQYYSSKDHLLSRRQLNKAQMLVKLDKIQYDVVSGNYFCLPITGYNSTTYKMERAPYNAWGWICDCQGCRTKIEKLGMKDAFCSHVHALHLYFDKRNREYGFGPYKKDGEKA